MKAVWRAASPDEDDTLVQMCMELYREDPGAAPVEPAQMRRTLARLRREPARGRAVVLAVDDRPVGYAILISFWSNELGGEVCEVDELFVAHKHRREGHGRSLFTSIEGGALWPGRAVAIALGVTPDNARARRLYERLGFDVVGVSMVKRLGRARAR